MKPSQSPRGCLLILSINKNITMIRYMTNKQSFDLKIQQMFGCLTGKSDSMKWGKKKKRGTSRGCGDVLITGSDLRVGLKGFTLSHTPFFSCFGPQALFKINYESRAQSSAGVLFVLVTPYEHMWLGNHVLPVGWFKKTTKRPSSSSKPLNKLGHRLQPVQ